jgi:flagellar hook-associated protein 2
MATSSVSSSALDVNSIVASLMEVERQPLAKLAREESRIQAKISALGTIKSALAGVQTAAQALAKAATFTGNKATVTGDHLSASADATAVAGNYSVEVQALAKAQTLASGAFVASTTVIGGGTLTFQRGTYASAGNTFTPSASASPVAVTIAPGSTLEQVRDAINAANAGVSASLVTDATGVRLSLVSSSTGADNGFQITALDDDGIHTDTSGLSQLAFDPTAAVGAGENLTQTRAPANATVVINGLTISNASNVVTGAIQGVTLTLKKEEIGKTSEIAVARDTGAAKAAVEAFVKAYNAAETALRNSMAFEPNTRATSPLNGDSTPRSIQAQLRSLVTGAQSGAIGVSTLSAVGVGFERDGTLKFDGAKFDAALAADPTRIEKLFSQDDGDVATSGFGVLIDKRLTAMLGSGGAIQARTDGLNASQKRIDAREIEITRRLGATEASLRKKYSALDAQLAALQGQSDALANALAQLPGSNNGRS